MVKHRAPDIAAVVEAPGRDSDQQRVLKNSKSQQTNTNSEIDNV
jgi:hypothetical protein